jgi:hypothetical protein
MVEPRGSRRADGGRLRGAQRFGPVVPLGPSTSLFVEQQLVARELVGQSRVVRRPAVLIRGQAIVVRDIGVVHPGGIGRVAGAGQRARPAALADATVRRRFGASGAAGAGGAGGAGRPSTQQWRAVVVRGGRRPGLFHGAEWIPAWRTGWDEWLGRRSSTLRRRSGRQHGCRPGHG